MSIYDDDLYIASEELYAAREKFSREFNYGKFAGCKLRAIPEIDDIRDNGGWRLAENSNGRPVGIEHLITWGSSVYVDGDFTKVYEDFGGEVLAMDGTVSRQERLVRELTADEQKFAKEKFAELLVNAQADLIEQREYSRQIMKGEYDDE